ncbi:dolichol kinase-like [Hydractinia symbiolongicarpus]|uniref:dolichol kinase-like n=1 Tax=Hydractinia symbiolongicarpus TaxID=13093 RepID=UPI002549FC66|nr:dolichol kinase-like [Hydractinia symbiolongicarpus]
MKYTQALEMVVIIAVYVSSLKRHFMVSSILILIIGVLLCFLDVPVVTKRNKELGLYCRGNSDPGFLYSLLTVPTLFWIQKSCYDTSIYFDLLSTQIKSVITVVMALSFLVVFVCLYFPVKFSWIIVLLAVICICFDFDQMFLVVIICAFVYTTLACFAVLKICPYNFTIGEVGIIIQGFGLVVCDFGCRVFYQKNLLQSNEINSVVLIEFMLCSVVLMLVCIIPVAYYINRLVRCGTDRLIHHFLFYFASLLYLGFVFVFLRYYFNEHPITWLIHFLVSTKLRLFLMCYSFLLVAISFYVVFWYFTNKTAQVNIHKTIIRKIFHIIAVILFLPVIVDVQFYSVISMMAFLLFLSVEIVRICHIKPCGDVLNQVLTPFRDEQDEGVLILTHIYLLCGMSLPIWLHFSHDTKACQIAFYSGIISLGIGDTAASVFGKLYGKTKWHSDSKKTIVGTLFSVSSQFMFSIILIVFLLQELSSINLLRIMFCCLITSLLEAWSSQIDNLILPLYMYMLFVSFCSHD